jgi:hypothetical protein
MYLLLERLGGIHMNGLADSVVDEGGAKDELGTYMSCSGFVPIGNAPRYKIKNS